MLIGKESMFKKVEAVVESMSGIYILSSLIMSLIRHMKLPSILKIGNFIIKRGPANRLSILRKADSHQNILGVLCFFKELSS